jgi:hypothetical protein
MARKKTTARPASDFSSYPSLNSPEFDQIAKQWLEELIRRAQAADYRRAASSSRAPLSLTVPARGEGRYAFNFFLTNMYDLETDPLGLMAGLEEVSREALEEAVREAGFDGMIVPPGPGMKGPVSLVFDFEESVRVPVQEIRYGVVH